MYLSQLWSDDTVTLCIALQAVSSGLQSISSKTPRDPAAAAMVTDAVRIIDNYIKVRRILLGSCLHAHACPFTSAFASLIVCLDGICM